MQYVRLFFVINTASTTCPATKQDQMTTGRPQSTSPDTALLCIIIIIMLLPCSACCGTLQAAALSGIP
jgi:hypothetical protein